MRPPDYTAKALRQFLEATPGEQARAAFRGFAQAQAEEEKRDARDRRQPALPGLVDTPPRQPGLWEEDAR